MPNSEVRLPHSGAVLAAFLLLATVAPSPARADTFYAGSLIIPMDLTYQDYGVLQAYGLVYQLLRHGIKVIWPIRGNKAQCVLPDPEAPEACRWNCDDMLESEPCPYPSFEPDLYARARILYSDGSSPREPFEAILHGYRAGAFLIPAYDAGRARTIIDAWNTPALWAYNPWARRENFRVVSVHEATEQVSTIANPTSLGLPPHAALLADSGEAPLSAILRAAGIPQTNGAPFPDGPCAPGACGPGTANPDLLPPETLFSEAGQTCLAPSPGFSGTLLLDDQARPKYAMLAASAWTAAQREVVTCEGGPCEKADSCFTTPVSFHGRRVLHHLNAFRNAGGVILTLGEASYTLENVRTDAAWPFLDPEAPGHLLTGFLPRAACPCVVPGESCIIGGCLDDQAVPFDCCRPDDLRVRDAGILPAPVSTLGPATLGPAWLSPPQGSPFFQYDGGFNPATGPLGIFSLQGAGLRLGTEQLDADEGYLSLARPGLLALADFSPGVALPVSQNPDTQVARLFLNALFSAPVLQENPPTVYVQFYPYRETCFEAPGPWRAEWTLNIDVLSERTADELLVRTRLPAGLNLLSCDHEFIAEGDGTISWSFSDIAVGTVVKCIIEYTAFPLGWFPLQVWARFGEQLISAEGDARSYLELQTDEDQDGYICDDPHPDWDCYCGDHDGDGRDDCYRPECREYDDDCCNDYSPPQRHSTCVCSAGSRSGPGAGGFFLLALLSGFVTLRRRLHG